MQSRRLSASLLTAGAVGLFTVQPVAAQETAQPAAAPTGGGLEEIVVTARRREERVQTVPMAITAFTQADIDKSNIGQLRDLYKAVPSLAVAYTSSDPNSFYSGQVRLRGLQGTEVYFADVPLTSADYSNTTGLTHGLSPGLYFDLDDVEIDKGAQGTLFGRPSIGGLISIQPKRPTNNFEGYLKTTFGNYSDKENEFALNIPIISDKLLVRVSGQMQQRDGYTLDLQKVGQPDPYLDNRNYYAWRIGVTLRPTDDIENYFLYDGYWQDSDGAADFLKVVNPDLVIACSGPLAVTVSGTSFTAAPAGNRCGATTRFALVPGLQAALDLQNRLGPRTVNARFSSGIGKDYFYGFTDVATWDITEDLSLKNIASARVFKQLGVDDFTNTGLGILTIGWPGNNHGWTDNSAQYTEELQMSGKALGGRLDWRVGGFLLFDHPIGYNTEVSDAVNAPTFNHFREEQRSQAVFAHGIYDLSDFVENLRFTAGYRYTWDYDSLGEVSTKPVDAVTRNASGSPTSCNIPIHDNNCQTQVDSNFKSFGWNLGLDYQWTPTTLFYIRSGNAYRPGGTNLAVPAPFNRFQPEHATDVEVGVKTDYEFMGVHARTNADYFHTFYKAIQVQQLVQVPSAVPGQPPSAQSVTANAASADLDGVELEQTINLPFGLDIAAHGSYFYSKYDQYPIAFGQVENPGFLYIPMFQFGVTPTYHVPIPEAWGDVAVSFAWSWYGHQTTSALKNEPLRVQPHYQNFDLNIDWNNIFGQPFDTSFFMTNVTDNLHYVGQIPLMTTLGFSSVAYNPPRMFGFSLKYRYSGKGIGL